MIVQVKPLRPSRSGAHLRHVRALACCACGALGPNDPHHFGKRGVGQRCSDYETVPLCRRCHDSWHGLKGALPGRSRRGSLRCFYVSAIALCEVRADGPARLSTKLALAEAVRVMTDRLAAMEEP